MIQRTRGWLLPVSLVSVGLLLLAMFWPGGLQQVAWAVAPNGSVSLHVSLQGDESGDAVSVICLGEKLKLKATVSGLDEDDGETVSITIYKGGTSIHSGSESPLVKANYDPGDPGTYKFKAKAVFSKEGEDDVTEWSDEIAVKVVGIDKIIVDGSDPEDEGPAYVPVDEEITLRAVPNPEGAEFPDEKPSWTITASPEGSELGEWTDTGATATIKPDVPGEYTVKAECGISNDSFVIHAKPRVDELTGTARHGGSLIPSYSVTVQSVTTERLYVCPSNDVQLSIATTPATLPPGSGSAILFKVEGAGANPSAGNFGAGNPVIDLGTGMGSALTYFVRVGVDNNGNGTLEEEEETHGFLIQKIDLTNAEIYANRTSTPVESAYPTKPGEHYEAGGTFKWELRHGLANDGLPIFYEYWDTDYFNDLIKTGPGTDFGRTISSSAIELGNAWVRFYCDEDGDGAYDSCGQVVDIEFWVQEKKVYNYHVETSDLLGAISHAVVQGRFTEAANHILRKDSEDDWRACVEFNVVSVNQFAHGTNRPDPVDASVGADLNKHFNAVDATFVETMLNAGGMGKVGSKGIIVEWNTTGWLDRAIAHEIGHNAGITHSGHSSQDNHLMHSSYLQAKDTELKASDVSYFD